jgi:hypothetical protein
MTEQNWKDIDARNDQQQTAHTSQMSTADIAARSNQGGPATPQARPNGAPREPATGSGGPAPLLSDNEVRDLRSRWTDIQAGFVDKPRQSVENADALVATVMQRLAETFANERSKLEGQWSRGDNVSTEELRVALQHYRSFFDRLLSL